MRPILLLAGLLAASTVLAQAYRWVDEDGIVHYSDRPEPGAERIQLPSANVTRVRPYPQRTDDTAQQASEDTAPVRYESVDVASPGPEETLWNIDGILNVSISVRPALQPGHQLRVYFDGEARMVTRSSFTIEEVYRGVHNLQVEILDETGDLMIRSRANRFYVQQSTVNF